MTLTSFRKRSRETTEEIEEYAPISKKLNGLHLDGSERIEATEDFATLPHHPQQSAAASRIRPECYHPSLNVRENPNYYEANRVLYEAHQLRLERLKAK